MEVFRVLEVVSGFGLGGAERALLTRMRYQPANFEVTVLNVRPEIDALTTNLAIKEWRIYKRGLMRLIGIYAFLSQHNFDAIIVRTPLDAIRFGLLKSLFFTKGPKLIFEAHSNFVSKKFGFNLLLTILLRIVSNEIDLVIAVSRNVLKGPLCRGRRNVQNLTLGAELEGSSEITSTPQQARLIFIGRLIALKRPIWLLERLLSTLDHSVLPKDALTIIGTGPLENELRKFIEAHNLKEFVNYVGAQANVTPYLLSATHLVSCSTNEGLPLTFFEAKLAGLSIIATPSGGGAEIFDKNDRELETFDKEEFEDALVEIFNTPPPTLEMRKKIQETSSWMRAENCATQYYSVVNDLIAGEK